ncbi:Ig-like domain-containing protein [Gemmobacter denitrificans]|uniref:Ig-like domain-containing protein n=1 Tax=Gemmobacter denitrificans TaxID=3123040 RepID=A0ABU8BQR7_9RHOB
MPVFALYNFEDTGTIAADSALSNGAQNGIYLNGAASNGTQAVLDGTDDLVKIYTDPTFQLDRGTLEIQFVTTEQQPLTEVQTVLSRDSVGTNPGGFRVEINVDGSITVSHESATGTETWTTEPGFIVPGDNINLTYSWDEATGGEIQLSNLTTGASFEDDVPAGLTMDQSAAGQNQPWLVGAGQSLSDPNLLNNVNQFFGGGIEYFSLSDTVDNKGGDPTANPDTATTDEDTLVNIPVLDNDTDPTGQPLTVTDATATNGTVTIRPDGSLDYLPNQDYNGPDTITYTVRDPDGNTSTSTVSVTVNPVNDAPVANPDTAVGLTGNPITIPVLDNDTDVDGDPLSISGTPTSPDGTVVVNGDGTITFTSNPGFTGETTITYVVTDPEGATDTGTVTVFVGSDPGPRTQDGVVRGTAGDDLIDTAYIDPFDDDRVDANDAILPGEIGNDDIILAGSGNDTVLAGDGDDQVTGAGGDDSLDGGVGNDFMTGDTGDDTLFGGAGDDTLAGGADENTLYGGDGNDSVIGGQSNDLIETGNGASSPDRAFPGLYPADGDPDDDRDVVDAGDGDDTIRTGDDADTIQAGGGADLVEAGDDADSVIGAAGDDTILGGEGSDTLTGDNGNDVLHGGTPDDATDPTHLADATDPDTDNNRDSLVGGQGDDSIYGGDDDDTLLGGQGNDLLDGGIDEDDLQGALGNDTLIGGAGADTLVGGGDRDLFLGGDIGESVDGSENGDDFDTLDLSGVGPISIVYDADNIENGTVTFLDAGGAATGTMRFVNIENVISDVPDANPDAASTPQGVAVTIPVLANDSDPNGDPLTVISASAPNGTVTINADGTLAYDPDDGFFGIDTITYTITDPDGNQDTTTVAVTVVPSDGNSDPVANPDFATTPINTAVTIPVLQNDDDVDGDPISLIGTPSSPNGTVTVTPDGELVFTPDTGFTGPTTITYEISDGRGGTDIGTVTVRVTPAPGRDGYVDGTAGGDLIDLAYTGDPDGDFIDRDDAILPGDAPNDDRVRAGDGNDTILAGLGDDSILAGDGDDVADGGEGDDTIIGWHGNDTILGFTGNDLVRGGQGDDLIATEGGTGAFPLPDIDYPGLYPADSDPFDDRDTIYGGDGNDTVRTGDDADLIYGGDEDDLLNGGIDNDTIYGGRDDDTVIGGEGADVIDLGNGDDLAYGGLQPDLPDSVNIPDATDLRPNNGNDLILGGLGNDTIFGLDDDDTIDGGSGNDLLNGGIDEDVITGGTGNDTIIGGQGTDTMFGGDDRDTFIVDSQNDAIGDLIDGNEGGDDFDTLDLRGSGPIRIDYDPTNAENGVVNFLDTDGSVRGTMTFTNIENVIPCFTPGTLIATPRGEVPVEELKVGDRVITRDNGIQQIRWMGSRALSWSDLSLNPHLKPILIRQGSLGNGLPERDMMVSPNHRVLVANDRTALYFDEHEVLVAAKHLVAGRGVHEVDSMGTTYLHMMFDRHEVVLSNGAWTESFQPGDYTLKGMGNAQRNEIFELFPELKTEEGRDSYGAARRTLKKHEAKLLVK